MLHSTKSMSLLALFIVTATVSTSLGQEQVDNYHVVPSSANDYYEDTNKACRRGNKCVYQQDFFDAIHNTTMNGLVARTDLGKGFAILNKVKDNYGTIDLNEVFNDVVKEILQAVVSREDKITVAELVLVLTSMFKTTECAFIIEYTPLNDDFFRPLLKDCPQ